MPAEFHFLRPEWLWALPAVIAATLLLAFRKLAAGNWQSVIDPALAPHILSRSVTRGSGSRWWLAGLGGVLAVLALAGPAWQRIDQPVFRSDQALVIALDLSRSMDAQDVAPSRLTRARLKILDILERRGGGQTALVVYSANAFTVTPLTTPCRTAPARLPATASRPAAGRSRLHSGRLPRAGAGRSGGRRNFVNHGRRLFAGGRACGEGPQGHGLHAVGTWRGYARRGTDTAPERWIRYGPVRPDCRTQAGATAVARPGPSRRGTICDAVDG